MTNQNPKTTKKITGFKSIDTLINRWKEGTLNEIIEDWQWIFSYSKMYERCNLH